MINSLASFQNQLTAPFGEYQSALDYNILLTYLAYGPGTMHGSDGMDSVTPAMRKAGTHSQLKLIDDPEDNGMTVFYAVFYGDSFFVSFVCRNRFERLDFVQVLPLGSDRKPYFR